MKHTTEEIETFLKTLNVHNKDIKACFNDALVRRHIVELMETALSNAEQRGVSKSIEYATKDAEYHFKGHDRLLDFMKSMEIFSRHNSKEQ